MNNLFIRTVWMRFGVAESLMVHKSMWHFFFQSKPTEIQNSLITETIARMAEYINSITRRKKLIEETGALKGDSTDLCVKGFINSHHFSEYEFEVEAAVGLTVYCPCSFLECERWRAWWVVAYMTDCWLWESFTVSRNKQLMTLWLLHALIQPVQKQERETVLSIKRLSSLKDQCVGFSV